MRASRRAGSRQPAPIAQHAGRGAVRGQPSTSRATAGASGGAPPPRTPAPRPSKRSFPPAEMRTLAYQLGVDAQVKVSGCVNGFEEGVYIVTEPPTDVKTNDFQGPHHKGIWKVRVKTWPAAPTARTGQVLDDNPRKKKSEDLIRFHSELGIGATIIVDQMAVTGYGGEMTVVDPPEWYDKIWDSERTRLLPGYYINARFAYERKNKEHPFEARRDGVFTIETAVQLSERRAQSATLLKRPPDSALAGLLESTKTSSRTSRGASASSSSAPPPPVPAGESAGWNTFFSETSSTRPHSSLR